jgi:hypothetical protein
MAAIPWFFLVVALFLMGASIKMGLRFVKNDSGKVVSLDFGENDRAFEFFLLSCLFVFLFGLSIALSS